MSTHAADFRLRSATPDDRHAIADLICISLNHWYQVRGGGAIFRAPDGPALADVFFDVYNTLEPGNCVVAEDCRTGQLAGSCFYHPRPTHVSLGIMNVHPNYFGGGVASALLRFITDFTDRGSYPALRLISSAGNLDSFSLYNRAGFVPRAVFQDMVVTVPAAGINRPIAGLDRVRHAVAADAEAMAQLEMEVSGISRGNDYAFCIGSHAGLWSVSVCEGPAGRIDGYAISSGHEALNIIGPCIARTDEAAAALLLRHLNLYRGRTPLFIVPVDHPELVRFAYACGARNVELHLCQVRGKFTPFSGVSMPTFLLETG